MVQKIVRSQGRPSKFDREETAARLQHAFWRTGYAGASLDDLTRATGLHKPSLYGAFGDKRQMYMTVLRGYLEASGAGMLAAMALPTLRDSLTAFYSGSIDIFARHADAPGCFLMATAVPMAAEDPEVGEIVAGAFRAIDRMIAKRLARAVADGELPAETDLSLAADFAAGTHFSLSARARAGADPDALHAQASRFVDYLCPSITEK